VIVAAVFCCSVLLQWLVAVSDRSALLQRFIDFFSFLFFQPLLRRLLLQEYRLGVTGLVAFLKFFFFSFSLFSCRCCGDCCCRNTAWVF